MAGTITFLPYGALAVSYTHLKLSALQSDFKQLSILCTEYIEFLRNSARSYRNTQDELTSQAGMLGM